MMARPTFRSDLLSNLFAALGTGPILSALTGQFARRGLHASTWIVALLVSLMPLGSLFGAFFIRHVGRTRRVRLVVFARAGMAFFLACIALLPAHEAAAEIYAALLMILYVLASIILNVQSNVRHSNYPAEVRGRIFSRLTIVQMFATGVSAILAGYALDQLAWGHRLIYILAAAAMIISGWFYNKMRVRRERALMRNGSTRTIGLLGGFRVLKEDPVYGRFMLWQMVSGTAILMTLPVLALVMTDYLKVGYSKGITAMTVAPLVVVICAAPLVGRLFDRVRVTRFRSLGAAMWGLSRLIIFFGVLQGSYALVLIGFTVEGVGRSTGNMAFNLGHMQFTSPDRSHEYMGIQLTLRGVRGLLAPMLGAALLKLPGVGLGVLVIAAVLESVAAAAFYVMPSPRAAGEEAAAGLE